MSSKLERAANIATIVGAIALCSLVARQWLGYNRGVEQLTQGSVGAQDAPAGTSLELAGLPVKGPDNARVVLVEFSDYECPYCAQHATGVSHQLDKEFVKTGQIRYAFANNPIPSHPNAVPLAQAAICAGQQDRYWPMHDRLFEVKPKTREELVSVADGLGLDRPAFEQCFDQ